MLFAVVRRPALRKDVLSLCQCKERWGKYADHVLGESSSRLPSPVTSAVKHESSLTLVNIQPSLVEVARQQFFRGYSQINGHASTIDPNFELVESMHKCPQEDLSSKGCSLALEATSLAYMGTQGDPNRKILSMARQKYAVALNCIREALHNPSAYDIRRSLMAARLCYGYELIVSGDVYETGWAQHVQGQAHLARALLTSIDGGNEFDSSLFLATFTSFAITYCCARALIPFSKNDIIARLDGHDDLETRLACITIDVNKFRVEADRLVQRDLCQETRQQAHALLESARSISSSLLDWGETFRSQNPYITIHQPASAREGFSVRSELWSAEFHSYKSLHEANLFNEQRCWIIYTHTAIAQVCSWLTSEGDSAPNLEDTRIIQDAVNEVCASVPFYLGFRREPTEFSKRNDQRWDDWGGGKFSLWLWLSIIVGVESLPVAQRDWIVGRLRYVGQEHDFRWSTFLSHHPPRNIIQASRAAAKEAPIHASPAGWPVQSDAQANRVVIALDVHFHEKMSKMEGGSSHTARAAKEEE